MVCRVGTRRFFRIGSARQLAVRGSPPLHVCTRVRGVRPGWTAPSPSPTLLGGPSGHFQINSSEVRTSVIITLFDVEFIQFRCSSDQLVPSVKVKAAFMYLLDRKYNLINSVLKFINILNSFSEIITHINQCINLNNSE